MTQEIALIVPYTNDRVLLQLRDENAPTRKNQWALFGGAVEDGERPIDAVTREYWEELRLTPEKLELAFSAERSRDGWERIKHVFVDYRREEPRYELHEGKEARFFTEEQLSSLDMRESDRNLLMQTYDYIRRRA